MHPSGGAQQGLVADVGSSVGAADGPGGGEGRFQGGRARVPLPPAHAVVDLEQVCGRHGMETNFRNYSRPCRCISHSLELNLRAHSRWCWCRYVRLSLPQTAYRSRTLRGACFSDVVRYFIFWQLRCTGQPHFPPLRSMAPERKVGKQRKAGQFRTCSCLRTSAASLGLAQIAWNGFSNVSLERVQT